MISDYKMLILTGYKYGGPEIYNVCQVLLDPSVLAVKEYVSVPFTMVAASEGSIWNSGLQFHKQGDTVKM